MLSPVGKLGGEEAVEARQERVPALLVHVLDQVASEACVCERELRPVGRFAQDDVDEAPLAPRITLGSFSQVQVKPRRSGATSV